MVGKLQGCLPCLCNTPVPAQGRPEAQVLLHDPDCWFLREQSRPYSRGSVPVLYCLESARRTGRRLPSSPLQWNSVKCKMVDIPQKHCKGFKQITATWGRITFKA